MAQRADTTGSTREAILEAAQYRFARSGFAATTIKDIAAEANVNSALLYYYFVDKETLYRETLLHAMRTMAREASREPTPELSPDELLGWRIEHMIAFLAQHPHIPRLIMRELIDHEARHAQDYMPTTLSSVFKAHCDLIERGQRLGLFRSDLDPRYAAIATISVIVHFFTARPAIGILLGAGTGGPTAEQTRAYAQQASEYALAALRAPAARARRAAGRKARAAPRSRSKR